jgi:hypothetical protein
VHPFRVSRADVAIAGVVTVAMLVPVLVPHRQPWWVVALALLTSVPVLWRRTFLVPAIAVSGCSMTVLALAHHRLAHDPAVLLPYGPLVCTYTFAMLMPPLGQAIGGVVLAAGVIVSLVLPHENFDTFGYVVTSYVAAYALGLGTRARRAQREAVEERAARLEEARAAAIAQERTRIASRRERMTAVYRKGRSPRDAALAMFTDQGMRVPATRLAAAQSRWRPAYVYEFDWRPPEGVGAVHTIELPFMFGTLRFTGVQGGPEALRTDRARLTALSDRMVGAWTSFARTGHPGWTPYAAPRRTTMIWDLRSHTADDPRGFERAQWDGYVFGSLEL